MFNLSNLVNIQIPNFLEHNQVLKNCVDIKNADFFNHNQVLQI